LSLDGFVGTLELFEQAEQDYICELLSPREHPASKLNTLLQQVL
jgi:hypothetical protein